MQIPSVYLRITINVKFMEYLFAPNKIDFYISVACYQHTHIQKNKCNNVNVNRCNFSRFQVSHK